MTLLSNCYV